MTDTKPFTFEERIGHIIHKSDLGLIDHPVKLRKKNSADFHRPVNRPQKSVCMIKYL